MTFFNKLYFFYYKEQEGLSNDPEIMPIITIAFCQCSNIFMFVILFFFNTSLKKYGVSFLVISFLALLIMMLSANFYYYIINKKGKTIINTRYQITNVFRVIAFIYRVVAFFAPVFLIYWFQKISV